MHIRQEPRICQHELAYIGAVQSNGVRRMGSETGGPAVGLSGTASGLRYCGEDTLNAIENTAYGIPRESDVDCRRGRISGGS